MENNMKLAQWVNATTGSDSWRNVAEKLHTTHPTIQRRLKNAEADAIVELAAAYNTNPIPGLIAAGTITKADVLAYAGTYAVEDLTDVELAQIMVDRLAEHEREETIGLAPHLTPVSGASDSMPLSAVAYSGPDEDAERNDVDDD
ncbi:TPA: hypothetical protein I8W56_002341 [Corynebacterium striatum]|nr:hypothetical protein [Corynebacterium striatum]HAT1506811.1 hypothetical protein [Corynebacterium striatum]